jgi:hypothetical protein
MEPVMTVTTEVAEAEAPLSVSTYRYPTGWYIVANPADTFGETVPSGST